MKWMVFLLMGVAVTACMKEPSHEPAATAPDAVLVTLPRALTDEVRKELLEARDSAWRAFFRDDHWVLARILGPELIAIQQSENERHDRPYLLNLAKRINEQRVQLLRLEFPRTEMELFGDTAVLYYTYVMETGARGQSVVDAGRGTEVFVLREGRWVDVGWHLDNGAFLRKDGEWIRRGD